MKDPREPWDDARLDAAFRARFDRPAPTGIAERVTADLGRTTRRFPGWRLAMPSIAGGLLATAAAVLILVVGSRFIPSGPGATTISPGTVGTQAPGQTQVAGSVESPTSVVWAKNGQVLPVLTVPNGLVVRDRGVDATEIAVGGWFVRFIVPCPMPLTSGGPLDRCDINVTWLMAAPEQLSVTDSTGAGTIRPPVGPAFNVVADSYRRSDEQPQPVVFIGHFDDARAAGCPPADHQKCADRFVVDQVALTASQRTGDFPAKVANLPVETVDDAILVREAGAMTELAIAGWFQWPLSPSFCPFVAANRVPWLVGDCNTDATWLMDSPESLWSSERGQDGTFTVTGRAPTGPAVNVTFPGLAFPTVHPLPDGGTSQPTPMVVVGHFNDLRALECPLDRVQACDRRFVVDAIAWSDGDVQALPGYVDLDGGATRLTAPQQATAAAFVANHASVVQVTVGSGSEIGGIEPALVSSDVQNAAILGSEPALWLATVIEPIPATAEPVTRTYVIDTQGKLYFGAPGAFVAEAPEPSP
jgi:hypothetical protein